MKHNCGDLKVKWNHHGHKYKFFLTQQELAQDSAFEILLQKIRQQCPDFDGVLASYDSRGDERIEIAEYDEIGQIHGPDQEGNIVATESEFRELLAVSKGRLKIYTVRRYLSVHPSRSHSVPLDITRLRQISPRSTSCLRSPPPSYRESQEAAMLRASSAYQQHTLPHWGTAVPFSHVPPPPAFGCTYAHYDPCATGTSSNGRYGQSLFYGYPPQSSMMYSFLCSPFPFGGHHRSWLCGPKCFTFSLGGKCQRSKCTSWWNSNF